MQLFAKVAKIGLYQTMLKAIFGKAWVNMHLFKTEKVNTVLDTVFKTTNNGLIPKYKLS